MQMTVLTAANEKDLDVMLELIVLESSKKGLSLNLKKTETLVISKNSDIPKCNIKSNVTILTQVHKLIYLGTTITSDGSCITEIKS